MKRFSRVIVFVSLALVCFWILTAIFSLSAPLEFAYERHRYIFETTRFWGLPITVFFTLMGLIKESDKPAIAVTKTIVAILCLGITILIMVAALFDGMCLWHTNRIIFENRKKPSIKIVDREFGCGATDSGIPVHKCFKLSNVTRYFLWVTEIDTSSIDKTLWNEVNVDVE